ncbi:MAG: hypothetical protein ACTSRI_05090 [Promethearchaeota archaeon]
MGKKSWIFFIESLSHLKKLTSFIKNREDLISTRGGALINGQLKDIYDRSYGYKFLKNPVLLVQSDGNGFLDKLKSKGFFYSDPTLLLKDIAPENKDRSKNGVKIKNAEYISTEELVVYLEEYEERFNFKVNEHITVKLDGNKIKIFVDGSYLTQLNSFIFLAFKNNIDSIILFDSGYKIIENCDDIYGEIGEDNNIINPEEEFWEYCSNLKAWAENNYDTNLLDRKFAFILLKKLTEVGDLVARRVFKEEVARWFASGQESVMNYFIEQRYLEYLDEEEFESVLEEIDASKLNLRYLLKNAIEMARSRHARSFFNFIKNEINQSQRNFFIPITGLSLNDVFNEGITITSDGKMLYFGTSKSELMRHDVVDQFSYQVEQFENRIETITVSCDEKLIAVGFNSDSVILMDGQNSKNKKLFNINGIVKKIKFTPNSKYLIATAINEYDEACLHVWDLKTRRLHVKFTTNSQMAPFDVSPDGKYLIFASSIDTIIVFEIRTKKIIKRIKSINRLSSLFYSSSGKNLIGSDLFEKVMAWDINTEKLVFEKDFKNFELEGGIYSILNISRPFNNSLICVLIRENDSYQEKLLIYDYLKDEILDFFSVIAVEERGEAWDVEISRDGNVIACYILGGYIKMFMKLDRFFELFLD